MVHFFHEGGGPYLKGVKPRTPSSISNTGLIDGVPPFSANGLLRFIKIIYTGQAHKSNVSCRRRASNRNTTPTGCYLHRRYTAQAPACSGSLPAGTSYRLPPRSGISGAHSFSWTTFPRDSPPRRACYVGGPAGD